MLDRDHLEVITSTMRELPAWVDKDEVEHTLLQAAESLDAKALSKVGDRLLATVAPDGKEPKDDAPEPARNLLRYRHTRTGRAASARTSACTSTPTPCVTNSATPYSMGWIPAHPRSPHAGL